MVLVYLCLFFVFPSTHFLRAWLHPSLTIEHIIKQPLGDDWTGFAVALAESFKGNYRLCVHS